MKIRLKIVFLYLIIVSVFSSCLNYKVMHYNRDEIAGMNDKITEYKVYIHAKDSLFRVTKPTLSAAGVKGELTLVTNPDTIAEIKNPRTKPQFKKHKHDLNIYTKAKIKDKPNDIVLKKVDIVDVTRITSKVNIIEDIGTVVILALGVAVIYGVIWSFHGLI